MKNLNIPFRETGKFSSLFLSYLEGTLDRSSFYTQPFQRESFQTIIDQYKHVDREKLVSVLQYQNQHLPNSERVFENISSLKSSQTFTITTGHQLNIFTGPLFFVFKILTTIRLCEELKKTYPNYNFVPIYWMASEDHDFEEINHFTLFGKTHTWNSTQTGPVGRFQLDGISDFLEQLPDDLSNWKHYYSNAKTLAEATRNLVHSMFQAYGLIILDADDVELKKIFSPIVKKECFEQKSLSLVEENTSKLEELGYKGQIFPRPVNLFYIQDQMRERIVSEDGVFKILNTSITFSPQSLDQEIDLYPERFSPNVVLRPVYQQQILPNLAYVGGPAELVYWLQIKPVFDLYNIVFPVLTPRTFGMIVPTHIQQKISKLGISYSELFSTLEKIKKDFVSKSTTEPLSFVQEQELKSQLENLYLAKTNQVDATLVGFVVSEFKKLEKSLETIEKRLKKAEEAQFEKELKQLENVCHKLFPNGGLMERSESIFSFLVNDPTLIDQLHTQIDPFETSFNVFLYD